MSLPEAIAWAMLIAVTSRIIEGAWQLFLLWRSLRRKS